MGGRFIDNIYYSLKKRSALLSANMFYLDTSFGKIRVFDTKENKPIIINAPDGPNTIEHQLELLSGLSTNFRVICFEHPGLGFSYPTSKFNYDLESGSNLLLELMSILKVDRTSLIYSCSNSFYGLKAAEKNSNRFRHIFLAQTPSSTALKQWTVKSIPPLLKIPIIGQMTNLIAKEKFASIWYNYSLPKLSKERENFKLMAAASLRKGGCFCLSSLVQGLSKEKSESLKIMNTNVTMVWGRKDFTHRNTDLHSIKDHVPSCEIIAFEECGHFPELESTDRFIRLVNERLAK